MEVPEPEPAVSAEEFTETLPNVSRDSIILRDFKVLHDFSGDVVTKTILVLVVSVTAVASDGCVLDLKFRSCDGKDQKGYELITPQMPEVDDCVDQVWQLVRTSDTCRALSFKRMRCLESVFVETSARSGVDDVSLEIGTVLRRG